MKNIKVLLNQKEIQAEISCDDNDFSTDKFDYEGYENSLKTILELAVKDYWVHYVDINRHQILVAKTYLWVCITIVGVIGSIFGAYRDAIISNQSLLLSLSATIFASIIGFGLCLYGLPARKGYLAIPDKNWSIFANDAYQHLKDKNKNIHSKILSKLIKKTDEANDKNLETIRLRAKYLRITSWMLMASFLFVLEFAIIFLIHQST
jgi:hypothetical protein